jgi:hypothetical protein
VLDFLKERKPMDSAHVVVGVDTHRNVNVAVALDGRGRFLDSKAVATTRTGHAELLSWAHRHGTLSRLGSRVPAAMVLG